MAFEKNNKLSTGRPAGSSNKISKEIRNISAELLRGEMETLQKKLKGLSDSDYIKAIAMLYKNVLPAQKFIETKEFETPTNFNIEIVDRLSHLTHKEMDAAIDDYAIGQRNK